MIDCACKLNVDRAVLLAVLLVALAGAGEKELRRSCSGCHPLDVVRVQRLTRSEWDVELRKMEHMGAAIPGRAAMLDYLAARYGKKASRKQAVK